jgi:lysophospholipase L1-like esterase
MSRIGDWTFRALFGLLLFAGSAELLVKWLRPLPRVQMVTLSGTASMEEPLHVVDGVPMWRHKGSAARSHCEGTPQHTMLVLGTSISFGVYLTQAEAFTHHLQGVLDARAPGQWCVRNEAQPGFAIDGVLAVLRERAPVLHPDVVLVELGNLGSYTMLDGTAYNLHDVIKGPSGYPELLPLPVDLHRWLMQHSASWRYLNLATVQIGADMDEEISRRIALAEQAKAITEQASGRLAFWVPTWLDGLPRPADEGPLAAAGPIPEWAGYNGVPVLALAQAWKGRDTRGLALDAVHLNAQGHQELADTLVPWLDAAALLPPP